MPRHPYYISTVTLHERMAQRCLLTVGTPKHWHAYLWKNLPDMFNITLTLYFSCPDMHVGQFIAKADAGFVVQDWPSCPQELVGQSWANAARISSTNPLAALRRNFSTLLTRQQGAPTTFLSDPGHRHMVPYSPGTK